MDHASTTGLDTGNGIAAQERPQGERAVSQAVQESHQGQQALQEGAMMVQAWSRPESTQTYNERSWTGVVAYPDGTTDLVHCDAVDRDAANQKLQAKTNGRLVASMAGWHERRILYIHWGESE